MPTSQIPVLPTLSPSCVPLRSPAYLRSSRMLQQRLSNELRASDKDAWRIFCYVDGRLTIGDISRLLYNRKLPPTEGCLQVERCLLRLMQPTPSRMALIAEQVHFFAPPSPLAAPAAPPRPKPQPKPVPKPVPKPKRPVLQPALRVVLSSCQQGARQLWRLRTPARQGARYLLQKVSAALQRLRMPPGAPPDALARFQQTYRVPRRPDPRIPAPAGRPPARPVHLVPRNQSERIQAFVPQRPKSA